MQPAYCFKFFVFLIALYRLYVTLKMEKVLNYFLWSHFVTAQKPEILTGMFTLFISIVFLKQQSPVLGMAKKFCHRKYWHRTLCFLFLC